MLKDLNCSIAAFLIGEMILVAAQLHLSEVYNLYEKAKKLKIIGGDV